MSNPYKVNESVVFYDRENSRVYYGIIDKVFNNNTVSLVLETCDIIIADINCLEYY